MLGLHLLGTEGGGHDEREKEKEEEEEKQEKRMRNKCNNPSIKGTEQLP